MLDCGIIKLVSVGDICNVSRGASPRPIKKYLTQSGEGVPWIKIGDVSPFDKYIKKTNERITQEGAKKSRFLHKGDLILSNSMSFGRPYILKIDGCIHDGWISLSGFENYVLRDFLYEVLNTKCVQDYWAMKANNGGAMSNLNSDIVKSTIIKIPSLNVQEEIVKILDSFTNLIDALNEELSLRQKQFEYYREKLLTFDDNVKRIKLEDIGYFYGGLSGKTKNDFIEGNKKFISYMNVFTNSTICLDINDKVKISDGETQNKIAYGDIIFTGSSETPNECGMSSVVTSEIDEEIYLNSFCFGYRFNDLDGIIPKFFSFLMRSTSMRNEISKTANGVTRFNVSKKLLAKVNVFIPSLKVQQSIVEKLDAFESLISSLKEEIALRQKQYEYYREKLLTFD